ncbi:MAG: DegV family protein [Firmicutes bacterium]|nr:DegV family protein [Bacillota bacterium]
MHKIAVVTDSTSDISPQTASANDIVIVPLSVIVEGKAYLDGVEITPSQFYSTLASSRDLPKTSQPTPEQFMGVYKPLLEAGHSIVSVHISGGLSSTVESARSAARMLDAACIRVIDSKSISYGIAFLALEAAKAIQQGLSLENIVARLEKLRRETEVLFTLCTLEYLHKGGRIGKVSALLGSLLDIKPVIRVEDGIYVPLRKVRTIKQALEAFVHYMQSKVGNSPVYVAVGHGKAYEAALALREMVSKAANVVGDIPVFEVGPVIGAHTGPGTVGFAFRSAAT